MDGFQTTDNVAEDIHLCSCWFNYNYCNWHPL